MTIFDVDLTAGKHPSDYIPYPPNEIRVREKLKLTMVYG